MKHIHILTALLLISCSARNSSIEQTDKKEQTETKVKAVDSTLTTKKDTTHLILIDSSNTDEITITPIDSSKEMVVNGKKYKNAKISHRKHKQNKSIEVSKNVEQSEQKAVIFTDYSIKKVSEKNKSKYVEKKALFPWWLWLLMLIVLLVAGRLAWLYYKGVNPFSFVTNFFKK